MTAALPQRVLVIAGATAAGKSALAARLAQELGAEIVGADSRQVYRYMDVGTAKPEPELRARVPHHMIDIVDPDVDFDVATWRASAMTTIAGIHSRAARVIVCGGTGLYLRSLTRGLFAGPTADPALRLRLEQEEAASPGVLRERLGRVDPAAARRIHGNDRVRIVRALEVYERTGRPMSEHHAEHALGERPFETTLLEVRRDRGELLQRIDDRARAMVAAGLVEELASLRERFGADARAFDAIGYRQAGMVLDGKLASDGLVAAIARATSQYAKRQRTWLRGQATTVAVAARDIDGALAHAEQFFSAP